MSLRPSVLERGRQLLRQLPLSWSTTARRIVACVLVLVAIGLMFYPTSPHPATVSVLVAARDLAPGVALEAADLTVRPVPPDVVPSGAITDATATTGRLLVGAVRQGEILTDARLIGPELHQLAGSNTDMAAVGIKLTDQGITGALSAGHRVDVVAAEPISVLAENVAVLAVRPSDIQGERLVLVALPRETAAKVAALTLTKPVTFTLR